MNNINLKSLWHGAEWKFVHWGLYALPARHEWVKNRERITDEDYDRYFRHFEPDLYDPRAWARAAKQAGMKYVVLTTKHHDGFCLWDSKLTDYTSMNTPIGKDLVAEFVDAVRATPTSSSTASTRAATTRRRRSSGSTRAATWPGTAPICTARWRSC